MAGSGTSDCRSIQSEEEEMRPKDYIARVRTRFPVSCEIQTDGLYP